MAVRGFLDLTNTNSRQDGCKMTAVEAKKPIAGPHPQSAVAGELKVRDLVALSFAMMVERRRPLIGLIRHRGWDARQPEMRPHPQIAVRRLRQRPHDTLRRGPWP